MSAGATGRAMPGPQARPLGVVLTWLLLAGALGAQVAWPLLPPGERIPLTITVVLLLTATSVSHAVTWYGWRWAAQFALTAGSITLAAEVIGVHTGLLFGEYAYATGLGPSVLGVPLLIPLAWTMLAYPAFIVARQLTTRRTATLLTGAWALASWDLFLDPQMVAEGHWRWAAGQQPLPLTGYEAIPLHNLAGWCAVSLLLMAALSRLPRRQVSHAVPDVVYVWTWLGGVVANLAFLGRPWVALWGGLAMGLIGLPLLVTAWSRRAGRAPAPVVATRSEPRG